MLRRDALLTGELRDRRGHATDLCPASGGERKRVHGPVEELGSNALERRGLAVCDSLDSCTDDVRRLAWGAELARARTRDDDDEVKTVEEGP